MADPTAGDEARYLATADQAWRMADAHLEKFEAIATGGTFEGTPMLHDAIKQMACSLVAGHLKFLRHERSKMGGG